MEFIFSIIGFSAGIVCIVMFLSIKKQKDNLIERLEEQEELKEHAKIILEQERKKNNRLEKNNFGLDARLKNQAVELTKLEKKLAGLVNDKKEFSEHLQHWKAFSTAQERTGQYLYSEMSIARKAKNDWIQKYANLKKESDNLIKGYPRREFILSEIGKAFKHHLIDEKGHCILKGSAGYQIEKLYNQLSKL